VKAALVILAGLACVVLGALLVIWAVSTAAWDTVSRK
jgi:hypothetical protein